MKATRKDAARILGIAVIAFAVLCGSFAFIGGIDDSDADPINIGGIDYTPTDIVLSPGASWSYTAQFADDLKDDVVMEIDTANSTSGINSYAVVNNHTVTVNFPVGTATGAYRLVLKATHAPSEQITYQVIDFNLVSGLEDITEDVNDIIKGTEMSFTVQVKASSEIADPTFVWEEVSGVDGMTFNPSTHSYTGTPSVIGSYELKVKVTCDQTREFITISIPFTVYSVLPDTADSETILSTDGSQKSSTQVEIPSDLTVTWQVTSEEQLPAGFTLNQSTGVVTGSSLNYNNVTVTLTGTTTKQGSEPVQTITKELTIQTENILSITAGNDILTYKNKATAVTSITDISSELSEVTWNVTGYSEDSLSISNGVVSVINPATAGMGQTLTITASTAFGQSKTTTITLDVEDTLVVNSMKYNDEVIDKANTYVGSSKTVTFDITGGSANTLAITDSGSYEIIKVNDGSVTVTGNNGVATGSFEITITSAAGQVVPATFNAQVYSAISFVNLPSASAVFYPAEEAVESQ